jgi:hypothetical protein
MQIIHTTRQLPHADKNLQQEAKCEAHTQCNEGHITHLITGVLFDDIRRYCAHLALLGTLLAVENATDVSFVMTTCTFFSSPQCTKHLLFTARCANHVY